MTALAKLSSFAFSCTVGLYTITGLDWWTGLKFFSFFGNSFYWNVEYAGTTGFDHSLNEV